MAKKKKGKPKRAHKAHEEEEGDWDDYKTFEEWHRESMRRIAEEDSRGGRPRRIVEEEGQQLYVLWFLRAFTVWDEADIRTFIRQEGLHTRADLPRLLHLTYDKDWSIPWTNETRYTIADHIKQTETMVEPLPSTETLPSKEKVIAVGGAPALYGDHAL